MTEPQIWWEAGINNYPTDNAQQPFNLKYIPFTVRDSMLVFIAHSGT